MLNSTMVVQRQSISNIIVSLDKYSYVQVQISIVKQGFIVIIRHIELSDKYLFIICLRMYKRNVIEIKYT